MSRLRGAALLLALSGLTMKAGAQLTPPRLAQPKVIRSYLGGGLIVTQPVGEFAENVGVLIPLRVRSAPVAIDLGAHYMYIGKARYLTPGDIHEQNDGTVNITAHHSQANMVMYRVGVRVGVT